MVIRTRSRRHDASMGALALVGLTLLAYGCAFFPGRPETLPPAAKLFEEGESLLGRERHDTARDRFRKIVERHPDSDLVPVARFLVGETYFRDQEYDRAAREFEAFLTFFPSHQIADFAQYRLARCYFDQMPSVEKDQAVTSRGLVEFQRLFKQYPESRYAPDAIVKMEALRLRLAQKELWVADYYVRQSNLQGALQRYDGVLTTYKRTAVVPQTLYLKADALIRLGRTDEAAALLRRLVELYPASEWSRRARQRQAQLL